MIEALALLIAFMYMFGSGVTTGLLISYRELRPFWIAALFVTLWPVMFTLNEVVDWRRKRKRRRS